MHQGKPKLPSIDEIWTGPRANDEEEIEKSVDTGYDVCEDPGTSELFHGNDDMVTGIGYIYLTPRDQSESSDYQLF